MRILVSFLLLVLIFGCWDVDNKNQNISAQDIGLLDSLALEKMIQQRSGKALLVNVWATWCVPCREEFPELVELARKFQNKDVEIVGISADFPDEIEKKVVPFLKEQKVNFPNYVQNFSRQEKFINMMNQEWSGALPATFIYDDTGRQRFFVVGKQTLEEFIKALDQLESQ
ncbi:MAG: TlpA family protein disulfide reductase [Calditrichaeota bacterium]|nr:TlpA family protein disulfide reductase [Calditrichota bacterium]RQW08545.1 MAG: TlpA family protein disulfide reductase [Calditrichota bacterium]